MEKNSAVIILNLQNRNEKVDVEIPLNITANDLVIGLNEAFNLGIDVNNVSRRYLKAENPIVLLKGNRTLEEFGIHSGTVINFND